LKLKYIENPENSSKKWKQVEGDWSWFLAVNSPKITTSKSPVCQTTLIGDGIMELIYAPAMDRADLAQLLLSIEDGKLPTHPKVTIVKVKAFILEPDSSSSSASQAPIAVDGERTDNTAIKVEVHQRLIRLFR